MVRFLEVAAGVRARTQTLHGGRDVVRLPEISGAELLRPFELLAHHLQHLRDRAQRFDARIPALQLHGVFQRRSGHVLVGR